MLTKYPIQNKKDNVLVEMLEVDTLLFCCCDKHYNQRQLKEEGVYLGIWLQRDESIHHCEGHSNMWQTLAAAEESLESTSLATKHKAERELEVGRL